MRTKIRWSDLGNVEAPGHYAVAGLDGPVSVWQKDIDHAREIGEDVWVAIVGAKGMSEKTPTYRITHFLKD